MKKTLALFLSIIMIFCYNTTTLALGDDVDMDFDMDDETSTSFSVNLEEGKDDGYITKDGDKYTATPYDGNEFLGWYKKGSSTPYSTEATATLTNGEFVAKFQSHNNVTENGFEAYNTGHDFKDITWFKTKPVSWMNAKVSEDYAKSGKKSLKLLARNNKDIYFTINNLKPNTEYVVSYSWLLPLSAITATHNFSLEVRGKK